MAANPPLAEHYNLDDTLLTEMYDSGNGPIFADRVGWSISYLNMAGLIAKPKRAHYALNGNGRRLASQSDDNIQRAIRERLAARNAAKAQETVVKASVSVESTAVPVPLVAEVNPQDTIEASFKLLKQLRYQEILELLQEKSPASFERIVVRLLQRMGYGAEIANSGRVTALSRDGGIDGIIKEDVLGFGRIYIQAKRYTDRTVGRPEIQAFVGALAGAGATKGVFITTSGFSADAIRFAESLATGAALILIDGQQLGAYIYEYGLGMQTDQTLELKKLDVEWWEDYPAG